ncbi:MAG: response regulator [Nitrososphaerales archaeon]
MATNDGQGRFSQSFAEAIKLESNKKYESAYELYLKEADALLERSELQRSALCFLLAGRCKMQTQKSAATEFKKAAEIYLRIADQSKEKLPQEARVAFRCATKCFLRAGLFDRAQEAKRSADSVREGTSEIKQPIMIVDDSQVITMKLEKYVREFGSSNIVICNSGKEAVEKFTELVKERRFPIVLLDMVMPDLNGKEVASRMLSVRPETTIALITADSIDSENVREALANGVGYFLQKPFRYDQIKELLETIQYEENIV